MSEPFIDNPPLTRIHWPWTTATGVGAAAIGEDGEDWILEGHLDPEAALEVLRQCCATLYDESTADDCFGPVGAYTAENIRPAYGVFTEHAAWCEFVTGEIEDPEAGPHCGCEEYGWFVSWGKVTVDTPGAIPIMVAEG